MIKIKDVTKKNAVVNELTGVECALEQAQKKVNEVK